MNLAKSGNEIIDEARTQTTDDLMFELWGALVRIAAVKHGKSMDDRIFILSEDGTEFSIDPDALDVKDAYDRAMQGV